MVGPTRLSQGCPPQTAFPCISLQNFFLLLPAHFFFVGALKTIGKRSHILPSQEAILDHQTWAVTGYPLGRWYTVNTTDLKHCIPDIESPCSGTLLKFQFPEAILHNFVLKFHTHPIEQDQILIEAKTYSPFKKRLQNFHQLNHKGS